MCIVYNKLYGSLTRPTGYKLLAEWDPKTEPEVCIYIEYAHKALVKLFIVVQVFLELSEGRADGKLCIESYKEDTDTGSLIYMSWMRFRR